MDWIRLLFTCLITTGGFIAATYEVMARKTGLPVGIYFQRNGLMAIIGGLVTFAAIIFSAFINPWWSVFIVFIASLLLSQFLFSLFRIISQPVSVLLMLLGIILLFIKVYK